MPLNTVASFLCVAAGGAVGACLRYAISLVFIAQNGRFPYATLTVNLSGALAAGFVVTLLAQRGLSTSPVQLLVVVGFFGSFTTMSAFSVETLRLLGAGELSHALLNVVLTVAGCLLAAATGIAAARAL
ncbi:MAG: fluoride efflux transporter CrcB [Granulosicoccus sp.]